MVMVDPQGFFDFRLHLRRQGLFGFVPMLRVGAVAERVGGVAELAQGFVAAPVVAATLGDFERVAGVFGSGGGLARLAP